MKITLPLVSPSCISLADTLTLEWETPEKPVMVGAPVQCVLWEGGDILAMGAGTHTADSFLGCLVELQDHEPRLPATVVLALQDLAHQAVDVVAPRLSVEPLSSAVFAEEFAPGMVTTEGKTARSMENVRR